MAAISREVFISHSSEDEALATVGCAELEKSEYRCWLASRDATPGVPQLGQIIQAVRESRLVVLLFSHHASRSAQVPREIEFANEQRRPVLSLRLDRTVVSDDFAYHLRFADWHDVSERQSDQEKVSDLTAKVNKLLIIPEAAGQSQLAGEAVVAARFGDFEILATPEGKPIELGRGGMGVTYRARQLSMGGREVALKVIRPELLGDDSMRKRFLREAQIAGNIEHPNVASVYARGQEGDSYFYAMQLVAGVDLDRYVKANGPLTAAQALNVTGQVAAALEAANAKGLIHRDIKPGNIMGTTDRRNRLRIKLIDFGLAKNVGILSTTQSFVSGDQFMGTLTYASPEQCRRQELDTRSDLYSLGVTFWFLLTGKAPFRGSPEEVSGSHLFRQPPFDDLPALSPPVLELLKSLLAKDPAARPQTPADAEDQVEEISRGLTDKTLVRSPESQQPTGTEDVTETLIDDSAPLSLIGAPTFFNYLAPTVGQTQADHFDLLQEFPEGVSGRLFRAREPAGTGYREVGLKFLHPDILASDENRQLVSEEFERLQSIPSQHLVAHYSLELAARPPFLVREWLHGFSFKELLRWKQVLTPAELVTLLDPLPSQLDRLAQQSLALVEVSLGKLFLSVPLEITPEDFPALAKRSLEEIAQLQVKLNPLSLRGLVLGHSGSDLTMVSTSRLLALNQARIGLRGRPPVALLGHLIYELLSGHALVRAPNTFEFRPLPALSESGNRVLKGACLQSPQTTSDCQSFWQTLRGEIQIKAASPGQIARAEDPVIHPDGQAPAPPTPSPQRSGLLIAGTIIASALIIGLAIFIAIQVSNPPTRAAGPTPSLAIATPNVSVIPATPKAREGTSPPAAVASASPTPLPVAVTPSPSLLSPSPSLTPAQLVSSDTLAAVTPTASPTAVPPVPQAASPSPGPSAIVATTFPIASPASSPTETPNESRQQIPIDAFVGIWEGRKNDSSDWTERWELFKDGTYKLTPGGGQSRDGTIAIEKEVFRQTDSSGTQIDLAYVSKDTDDFTTTSSDGQVTHWRRIKNKETKKTLVKKSEKKSAPATNTRVRSGQTPTLEQMQRVLADQHQAIIDNARRYLKQHHQQTGQ
jgi:hypothetical protein